MLSSNLSKNRIPYEQIRNSGQRIQATNYDIEKKYSIGSFSK